MSHSPHHSAARRRPRPVRKPGYHFSRMLHDIGFGLVIVGVLILIKLKFERSELGELTEQASYQFLQHRLTLGAPSGSLPATIVDISPIEAVETGKGDDRVLYKPRKPLLELIEAIASKGPRAIGVDIEFSPRAVDNRPETEDDPEFFAACQAVEAKWNVPVYLAVYRGAAAAEAAGWLGLPAYQDLAKNAVIPIQRNTPVLVRFSQAKADPAPPRLLSLSAALADAYRKKTDAAAEEKHWLHLPEFAFEEAKPAGNEALGTEEYLVDYSSVNRLRENAIRAKIPADVANQEAKLNGRVVLLGNADFESLPPDSFIVPGQDQPVPGVYVHAAGAITLIDGPLFEVKPAGQILLDIVFALLVIGSVTAIRIHFERAGTEVSENRLELVMTVLAIILVIILGASIVRVTRILWTDFLLVALTLWIHPSLEHGLPDLWHGIRDAFRSMATATEKEKK